MSEHDFWQAVLYLHLLAMAFFVGGGWAMASHYHLWGNSTLQWKLGLVGVVMALTLLHLRHPRLHALQAAILLASLAIVWLGLDLAT